MIKTKLLAFAAAVILAVPGRGAAADGAPGVIVAPVVHEAPAAEIWRYPSDIATRDLYFGPGGKQNAPRARFVFLKEDLKESSPKFWVEDQNGVKWKVKLGPEAQAESVATRLAWAVGYFTDWDYLVPHLRVLEMPAKLHRGNSLVAPDGYISNARFERLPDGDKKLDDWRWRDNPFYETREFNGLRTLMALLNNWDLKDVNNSVYADSNDGKRKYIVSDLGATFGAAGFAFPLSRSRNNLLTYRKSKFITKVTPDYVDFGAPGFPAPIRAVDPPDYIKRMRLRWIGKRVPRQDARWISTLLSRLSRRQITDAFRAAGYSTAEVEGFADVVQRRIAELGAL